MGVAYLQELFSLPSAFPWTPGPTLPMEPVPCYYVQLPYPVFPLFSMLPSWSVPAITYEVALNQGSPRQPRATPDVTRNDAPPRLRKRHVMKRRRSPPPSEQSTEAVRSKATRARTRKSATSSSSETLRSSPLKEEQQAYMALVVLRLLRTAEDLGLSVPAKKEEPKCATHRFIYSAATLRSLNVHSRILTLASRSEHLDESPEGSGKSARNVRE
ncbi:hypothetical protein MRX96_055529 [Rhipicephalus microplus]